MLDKMLGLPGLIVAIILAVALVFASQNPTSTPTNKADCEASGGKWVQTMKSYHTCK